MTDTNLSLLPDLLRACALLEGFVREVIASPEMNDTDVWVLAALTGQMETPAVAMEPQSAAWVASRLGFARERVSMSVKRLCRSHHLRYQPRAQKQDGRAKCYAVTSKGRLEATRIVKQLVVLERELRYEGGIARDARKVDPQVVARCLEIFSPWREVRLAGLDERRNAAVGKASARAPKT